METKTTVVVTENRFKEYSLEREKLAAVNAELIIKDCSSKKELLEATAEADGILANLQKYDAEIIDNMKRCRIIARYGIGYDNVDIEAAKRKGIWVTNVPDYGAEIPVSEHTLALLLSCVRKIPYVDSAVKHECWDVKGYRPIYTVKGKTLGIIGYGKIGKEVVKRMLPFGLEKVLIYDPYLTPKRELPKSCAYVKTLEELLRVSDFITLHAPLNETSRHMLGVKEVGMMKKGVIIINTARGGIIDEKALIEGLQSGKIGFAGIDTFESEPLSDSNPLKQLPNVVLSNHIGFYSVESIKTLQEKAVNNICKVLKGLKPDTPVFQL